MPRGLKKSIRKKRDASEKGKVARGRGSVEGALALWAEYASKKSVNLRDQLIEMYMPLVQQAAERMSTKLPPCVDIGDLIGAGTIGLFDAIDKFDHTRGIKFETYCSRRISGSMLDDLRRYDWIPRSVRTKIRKHKRVKDELETKFHRTATDEEIAEYMNMTMTEYEYFLTEINVKTMVSLDRKWDDDDDNELSHLDTLTDPRTVNPLDELQRTEIKNLAIRGLSEKEKSILIMYYYDNLSLKEIGAVLGISESRVCQIHQQTLVLLRDKFTAREVSTI